MASPQDSNNSGDSMYVAMLKPGMGPGPPHGHPQMFDMCGGGGPNGGPGAMPGPGGGGMCPDGMQPVMNGK